jgi:hypothetical protein
MISWLPGSVRSFHWRRGRRRCISSPGSCIVWRVDWAFVRPADRDALRGADRADPRLAEAHVGTAVSRRQRARTSLRIITPMISAVCAGGNGPTSRRITATLPTLVVPGQAPFNVSGRLPARDVSQLCLSGAFLPWHPRGPLNQSLREAPSPELWWRGLFVCGLLRV